LVRERRLAYAVHGAISAAVTTTGATGYIPSECVATASDGGNNGRGTKSGCGLSCEYYISAE